MIEDLGKMLHAQYPFIDLNRLGFEQSPSWCGLNVDLLNYPSTCTSILLTIAIDQRLESEA